MSALLAVVVVLGAPPAMAPARTLPKPTPAKAPPPRTYCSGAYADDFAALSKAAVARDAQPDSQFTYCLRNVATYECLSYAPDGSVRRTKKQATAHGTAFGYRRQGQETLLLTNQHVAEYVAVTDEEHPVAGVPAGCKRVSDELRLVENERDNFAGDDILLTRVVGDLTLDVAVVKAKAALNVMPWKVGRSAALKERNVVEVRGFPLGAFRATTQGRVTTVFDHDSWRDWDHDDFVIDAQLSTGNSGSPVLAVSCATGEYELVGIFHADYSRGNSLNVVVHVDEANEMMTTLKRPAKPADEEPALTSQARRRLSEEAQSAGHLFFAVGSTPAEVHTRSDGALVYSLFAREFPTRGWPVLVLEDLDASAEGGFGRLGRVWFGNARGLKERGVTELEPAERLAVERTLEGMRRASLLSVSYRKAVVRSSTSRDGADELTRLERIIRRVSAQLREPAATVAELAERLGPSTTEDASAEARPFDVPLAGDGAPDTTSAAP
ncbi:MAG: S1C family serine protease [Myxococcota bacterium]